MINVNNNSLQVTQDSTIAKPKNANTYNNLVLSSDPNFKPKTSQFTNLTGSNNYNSTQSKNKLTPHKRLGNVISDLNFYNHLGYGSNSMQYKGLDSENRVFENFKTANKSRLALMQKIRDNLEKEDENKDYTDTTNNIKSMLTTHNMLEKIVYSLESEKQKYGANSKQYKDLVAKYQEVNPIAKEYNITDYVSLAKYYDLQSSEILSLNS